MAGPPWALQPQTPESGGWPAQVAPASSSIYGGGIDVDVPHEGRERKEPRLWIEVVSVPPRECANGKGLRSYNYVKATRLRSPGTASRNRTISSPLNTSGSRCGSRAATIWSCASSGPA